MNDTTIDLDQAEATLTPEISDEALEAAATPSRAAEKTTYSIISPFCA